MCICVTQVLKLTKGMGIIDCIWSHRVCSDLFKNQTLHCHLYVTLADELLPQVCRPGEELTWIKLGYTARHVVTEVNNATHNRGARDS